ncbi:MAG: adenosylcobalamin-dependent ribonucleoside-diphosphate reductase [Tenuifilum sp.]|uniref:adenosylcobalamin-dependent ribonucleoside-diphosphate reductase n=1 Tax=Tenuifilum sp. TaxID=2760880 RepID=UPI002B5E166C|nr:adenosylcobalamin-dependent ribonucleoside-diphosphate reductase [Tenuifilum sp.]HOK87031.1 adenosylcobalamin-dependent ribonucleoside-diphosphate reductase [Tenuifilum sp.]HON70015.1 adenosylcobalamin-dependent ribonucleoside-diphosphate reductase [Tenuifilum sp.]HOU75278.1 adenosylcobalamin-dependent ribonucleoside-diphosphate reductase [Tenuifilum sp.]HPP91033.1 adenosylcobalamin-dependent ribonucleoside-diphosphate reductase [Tenuifilum sp.]
MSKDISLMEQQAKQKVKTYTFEEAYEASIKYFKGDEMAAKVWVSKYALKDSFGTIYELTPDDMHWRLAREIARIERKYPNPMSEEEVYHLLKDFKYIVPQGGPMTGIGNKFQIASLSNCFVIGNNNADSYGGIMKVDEEQVQLMKRRGGVGHDLSHIRPKGSPVLNSALTSTGVVPFMERYSNSTREVAQDGRRGALMLSISIKHPDAEKFIDAKMEQGKITGANVSVKIDDEFMRAAIEGKPYVQQYPIDSSNPKFRQEINASELWKKIVHNAWKSAEPGILFWDTIIRESVPDCYADLGYKTVSTNPCGEIPLCPYDSCRLLALNLYSYVDNPFSPQATFNFELFKKHVHAAQRMMDDIIDLELEKIDAILEKIANDPEDDEIKSVERNLWLKIRRKTIEGRRTGIGITAEGDMLAALNLRYGSDDAIDFAVEVHKSLAVEAYRSSVYTAKERGAFPIFNAQREKDNPFINRIKAEDEELYKEMTTYGRRNIALLTIAPTGTTSLMTQTTSGIEPVFMPYYKRRRKVNPNDKNVKVSFVDKVGDSWEEFNVFHHKFLVWMEVNGYNPEEVKNYDDEQLSELVQKSPYYKATSNDVDWLSKVRMQGMIQKWVDHSISVTVNLPEDITEEMVAKVYQTAWESGCKGCTVYREGSRDGVLVTNKKEKEQATSSAFPSKRPPVLECDVIRFKNSHEDWVAFVGLYDGRPYEIFTGRTEDDVLPIPKAVTKGRIIKIKDENGSRYDFQYVDKYGYTNTIGGLSHMFNKEFWNYAKLISGVLRNGMPIPDVVNLVSSLRLDNESINSWIAGVERSLRRYIPDGTKAKPGKKCPECGSESLIYQEGCLTCKNCGHSKCG